MKRIIAFALVICMSLSMVVAVSAAPSNSFTRTLNLVRLIRAIFAKDDETSHTYGELEDGILTIYVATNGKAGAEGTKNSPLPSIVAARDVIRDLDKSDFDGIDVIVKSGKYSITETITFTSEDSGTENCPVRYIGEEDTVFHGGVEFDHTAFEKASGATLDLFPEEVRDKLYMYDLGKLGYTADDIARMLKSNKYYNEIGFIYVDGEQMDLARYPNANEGWIGIDGGYFLDRNGEYTENNGNNGGEDYAVQTIIEYGDEHMERVLSWKNREDLFVRGHYKYIWCRDDTEVTEIYENRDEILLPFSGGYFPVENGLLFFYNIPEELDVPGEFYVDDNAILYYYPEDNFETAAFTTPVFKSDFINITHADYLTFENLTLDTTEGDGINFKGNYITITGCTIKNIYGNAVTGEGANILFEGNEVCYIGEHAVRIDGGDIPTLTKSNNVICNNYVHNWSTRDTMCWGIDVDGCGSTVCHNEVRDSTDLGVCASGPYHTVEYNLIYKTNQFFTDGGALNTHDRGYGTVLRYNVIIDTGVVTDLDIVGVAGIISDGTSGNEIYGNIVYNTTGDSLLAAGVDRDTVFHHNLCIKPGREGIEMNCPEYAQFYRDDWDRVPPAVEDYLYSDVWQNTFPTLKGIHDNYDPENPDDPMFFYAPVGNKAYNNYLFHDKAYETYPPSQNYKQGSLNDIEDHVERFSGEDIETFALEHGNVTSYSSRRNKNPITISEALKIANDAVGTIMTEEQLNEVGRIGVDHGIGNMLVE
ncbi:MAG: right-handed parallel beta-helix repeat-containing protein [Ruminococcaceae bacterium]|nr:right-handed parallel beta-helix repeat-containing protein [Oscillospiraceae bacterium]